MSDNLERFYKFAEENMFRHTAQEEFAWNVWNAAIESVVVKLPDVCDLQPSILMRKDVISVLTEAGISYE